MERISYGDVFIPKAKDYKEQQWIVTSVVGIHFGEIYTAPILAGSGHERIEFAGSQPDSFYTTKIETWDYERIIKAIAYGLSFGEEPGETEISMARRLVNEARNFSSKLF